MRASGESNPKGGENAAGPQPKSIVPGEVFGGEGLFLAPNPAGIVLLSSDRERELGVFAVNLGGAFGAALSRDGEDRKLLAVENSAGIAVEPMLLVDASTSALEPMLLVDASARNGSADLLSAFERGFFGDSIDDKVPASTGSTTASFRLTLNTDSGSPFRMAGAPVCLSWV